MNVPTGTPNVVVGNHVCTESDIGTRMEDDVTNIGFHFFGDRDATCIGDQKNQIVNWLVLLFTLLILLVLT